MQSWLERTSLLACVVLSLLFVAASEAPSAVTVSSVDTVVALAASLANVAVSEDPPEDPSEVTVSSGTALDSQSGGADPRNDALVVVDVGGDSAASSDLPAESAKIYSPWRVETTEALRQEVIAVEAALALRATVDGAPAVYDSPSVSIALRKVSPEVLANEWVELKAPDGAELSIPPGAKQRHGGPVTITITSYHTGGRIKQLPGRVKYGKGTRLRRLLGGDESISGTEVKLDRVDFFLEKEEATDGPARHSVSWAGTVDVKVRDPTKGRGKVKGNSELGLGVSVPAHHTDYQVVGGPAADTRWPEDRQALMLEVESLVGLPDNERQRGYRKLARKWHPDKNPDDAEKSSVLFHLLQELRTRLLSDRGPQRRPGR